MYVVVAVRVVIYLCCLLFLDFVYFLFVFFSAQMVSVDIFFWLSDLIISA